MDFKYSNDPAEDGRIAVIVDNAIKDLPLDQLIDLVDEAKQDLARFNLGLAESKLTEIFKTLLKFRDRSEG